MMYLENVLAILVPQKVQADKVVHGKIIICFEWG